MKSYIVALAAAAGSAYAQQTASAYAQCGGQGWTGATTCVSGYSCVAQSTYYSQCVPGASSSKATVAQSSSTKATSKVTSTVVVKTTATTTTAKSTSAAAATSAAASSGKVKYAGVNISGFDFGCGTDGTCTTSGIVNPGQTGINQMNHFVKDDGLNAFRLPVGWQYLVNNNLGGTLDATNWANYDALVQGCVNSGASLCIVDVHNYARWNGAIIGQGGPTNAQFTSLWSQIATKYKGNAKIAFGIMNEPHDVDITTWAATVQATVTAIRQAGATSNLILLPGNSYTSAAAFVSNGSGAALLKVTNLDGSVTNLVFDVHAYLDSDNSGTHASCTTNNINNAFSPLATWLRSNKRQAMLTETGGGPNDSTCLTDVCQELLYLMSNSDVFLGWTGWGAGMFDTSYVLSETPSGSVGAYTDQPLVKKCIAGVFNGATKSA